MFNRQALMSRAWIIFRQTYSYPAIPFHSIGRPCFAWALRMAWHEAREAARVAAIPTPLKLARVEALHSEISLLTYRDDYRAAQERRSEINNELASLAA